MKEDKTAPKLTFIILLSISTYDTDYVLVKEKDLEKAIFALTEGGHRIQWEQNE